VNHPAAKCAILGLLALAAASCGGGGGPGASTFLIAGSDPADGYAEAPVDAPIVVTFSVPVNFATVTEDSLRLEELDGTRIPADVLTQGFATTVVRLDPRFDLEYNHHYRIHVGASIASQDGAALGADRTICFITATPWPRVRPDQILDLGDALNEPRYLARTVRLLDGRQFVFGGYTDPVNATDTIEVWDPAARTFQLHPFRMLEPRAEHTVTVLANGRVVIAGGVSAAGGEPLRTTEVFFPDTGALAAGPELQIGRRYHAASAVAGGTSVLVSGGFVSGGDRTATLEALGDDAWTLFGEQLPEGNAEHVQITHGYYDVYIGVGNFEGMSADFDGFTVSPKQEFDIRFRTAAIQLDVNRILLVGGDTRSMLIRDFGRDLTLGASDLLRERRGAHSVTRRDSGNRFFLAAGGFNIAALGVPALDTLEVLRYFPDRFGLPDVEAYPQDVRLPVPFAGHVAFEETSGPAVLAGGYGDGVGPHSRHVVVVLDDANTPPAHCD